MRQSGCSNETWRVVSRCRWPDCKAAHVCMPDQVGQGILQRRLNDDSRRLHALHHAMSISKAATPRSCSNASEMYAYLLIAATFDFNTLEPCAIARHKLSSCQCSSLSSCVWCFTLVAYRTDSTRCNQILTERASAATLACTGGVWNPDSVPVMIMLS